MSPKAQARAVLLATVFALLVGCSQSPISSALAGSAAARAPIIVGTLSTSACEAQTAPVYTAAQVAVERATRALEDGRLDASLAETVLKLGRGAKADLDAACHAGTLDGVRLAAADGAVAQMQMILGGAR
jgi:hypothetical protein